jgi:UDP-N-acetylmuramyl pentapeptide synthase
MQSLSNNVAHSQNLAVLAALAELGGEAVIRLLGNDSSSATIDGVYITEEDAKEILVSRIAKQLGI